jgi:hypothetical protein
MEEPHSAVYRIMTAVKISNFEDLNCPGNAMYSPEAGRCPGDHTAVINR